MYIPRANFTGDSKRIPEKKIIIFSGAGLDAPSGIQTFRGTDGLWNNHKIEDICDERTWKKNFQKVHNFYNERRVQLKDVKPNEAHYAIKRIVEKYGAANVYNITQNVSDLFERARVEALHIHGELTKMECEACGNQWDIEYREFNTKKDRCPKCDSLKAVRPKIVFFGGPAPMYSYLRRAMDYTMNSESIVVIVGTMGNVVDVKSMLLETSCTCILNNMNESVDLPEKLFDKIYYESCETAMKKIEKDIDELWDK